MDYGTIKVAIEQYSGLDKDALHVHAALLLYLIAMILFRQTRRSRIPWLFVLMIELANEALDLRRQYVTGMPFAWDESLKDLWNTMLWPTVLLFIGRYTTLFQRRRGVVTSEDSSQGESGYDESKEATATKDIQAGSTT